MSNHDQGDGPMGMPLEVRYVVFEDGVWGIGGFPGVQGPSGQISVISYDNQPGDQFHLEISNSEGTWSALGSYEGGSDFVFGTFFLEDLDPMDGSPAISDPTTLTYPLLARATFDGVFIDYEVTQGQVDGSGNVTYDVLPLMGNPNAGDPNAGDPNAGDPNAGGDGPMGMPVFALYPNDLGVHGPGDFAIMIEGPMENPT